MEMRELGVTSLLAGCYDNAGSALSGGESATARTPSPAVGTATPPIIYSSGNGMTTIQPRVCFYASLSNLNCLLTKNNMDM